MRRLNPADCAILHLGLKRPWYNRIDSGEKCVEFREAKQYWISRIENWVDRMMAGKIPVLEFQCGYSRFSPRMWFIAGNGKDIILQRLCESDPIQHPDLGEFPKDRYCLFIGERVILEAPHA